jgi:transposase
MMEDGMQSLSEDLRIRIVKRRAAGKSAAEVAAHFSVSVQTVWRVCRQHEEEGHVRPRQRGGYRRSRLSPHDSALEAWIEETPDITLMELQERLAERGVKIGIAALWHRLNRLGLSYKKNAARRRAGEARRRRAARRVA